MFVIFLIPDKFTRSPLQNVPLRIVTSLARSIGLWSFCWLRCRAFFHFIPHEATCQGDLGTKRFRLLQLRMILKSRWRSEEETQTATRSCLSTSLVDEAKPLYPSIIVPKWPHSPSRTMASFSEAKVHLCQRSQQRCQWYLFLSSNVVSSLGLKSATKE